MSKLMMLVAVIAALVAGTALFASNRSVSMKAEAEGASTLPTK